MKISRDTLGMAAEFAVASELGRKNIYAQPTFGHQKRTDLLIFGERNLLRLEVKGKQGRDWPSCKGIYDKNTLLVFVDFYKKEELDRPDFYILTVEEWLAFAKGVVAKFPDKQIKIDEKNVLIWTLQKNANGVPYMGSGVRPEEIMQHKEKWGKIISAVGEG